MVEQEGHYLSVRSYIGLLARRRAEWPTALGFRLHQPAISATNWHGDHYATLSAPTRFVAGGASWGSARGSFTLMPLLAVHSYNDARIAPNYTTLTAPGMIRRMAELSHA